jgi:hypothetical protein
MTSTDVDPIREVARANPVDVGELRESIAHPAHPHPVAGEPRPRARGGVVLTLAGAMAAVVAALLALPSSEQAIDSPGTFLRASAAVAAEQPSLVLADDEFARRVSSTWMAIPPGESLGGNEFVPEAGAVVRETTVLLNRYGGGDAKDRLVDRSHCTFAGEVLAKVVGELAFLGCRGGAVGELPLLDQRLGLDRGPLAPYALGAVGAEVDELPADPAAIGEALEQNREDGRSLGFRLDPAASEPVTTAGRLRSVAELLSNPVASPQVRAAAFEYAASLPGMTLHDDVTDPLGRPGTAIAIERPSWETSRINYGGPGGQQRIDFGASDTVVRDEVIIDPETSDVLATRSLLLSTDLEALRPWLEEAGAPVLAAYRTYEPVAIESRPDLVRSKSVCPDGTVIIHDAPAPPEGWTDLCDGHEGR